MWQILGKLRENPKKVKVLTHPYFPKHKGHREPYLQNSYSGLNRKKKKSVSKKNKVHLYIMFLIQSENK